MKNGVTTQDLVVLVNQIQLPMDEIETRTGLTRQGIWKRLKRAGVLVPRRAPGGAPSKVTIRACAFCGASVKRYKKRMIRQNQLNVFCNESCYVASLEQHPYEEWRQGTNLARAIVANHFPLERGQIVHHKDGDQRNNDLSNLMVFATQAQHMAFHRGRKIIPLFDGATVKRDKSITEAINRPPQLSYNERSSVGA